MSKPVALPAAFDGMAQDFPRNGLPKGKAWNSIDYVPQQLGAPATERGGWAYASPALGGVSIDSGATYVKEVVVAPFTGGTQLLTINDTGNLCKVTDASTASKVGAVVIPKQKPVFLNNVLLIPSADGTNDGKFYDGTNITAWGASVPDCLYAVVFAGRVWLMHTTADPTAIYPSDAGDATTYDTVNSALAAAGPITGGAALPNVMLVFTNDHAMRIRGTTPPPGSDLIVDDPIFRHGCSDARSIAVNGSNCCFANSTGVYMTNGTAQPIDLTEAVGLKQYWVNLLTGYSSSTWSLAGDWYGNIYVITVMNGSSFVDAIAFDARRSSGWRISNLDAVALESSVESGQELYAASRGEARVYKLSTMFTPGSSYKADGDGTAVTATYESPFYEPKGSGGERWIDTFVDYDLRDAASDSPTMTLAYCTSPESGAAYTTLSPTLAATTKKTMVKIPTRGKSMGIGFKVTRTNASALARLYGFGSNVQVREGSRRDY